MSVRNQVLFEDGRASAFLRAQWVRKGALQPLSVGELIGEGGMATAFFSSLWNKAFPDRTSMPLTPVANKDGTGTSDFWDVFT